MDIVEIVMFHPKNHDFITTHHFLERLELRQNQNDIVPDEKSLCYLMSTKSLYTLRNKTTIDLTLLQH